MALPPALRAALPAPLHSAEVLAPDSPRNEALQPAAAAAGSASAALEAGHDPTHPFPPDHPYAKFIKKFKAMVRHMHAPFNIAGATVLPTCKQAQITIRANGHQSTYDLCVFLGCICAACRPLVTTVSTSASLAATPASQHLKLHRTSSQNPTHLLPASTSQALCRHCRFRRRQCLL
jgi:hypothetical protein